MTPNDSTKPTRPDLKLAMSRDQSRLHGLWSKYATKKDAALLSSFQLAYQKSCEEKSRRAAQAPVPTFDDDLPVAREAEKIIELISKHQVVVIAGETGSGKTTQLPKLCLAAGRGQAGMIGCTQPRRIAARAVARRVAEELKVPMGGAVGYQVRFTEQVGENTYIKFMTDGILLAEIHSDKWLSCYDTLIIDEAHERSLNIDFLLGYLRNLVKKRRDLKIIITSATIDTERFSKHFHDAPIVNVEGRSYPVETRYRPVGEQQVLSDENEDALQAKEDISVSDAIIRAADEITREDPLGDVLVFLPGEREIRDAHLLLERKKYRNTEILPLYARLSVKDQDRVFNPGPQRRIVLTTNVAETSLTVPRIRYVIDPGFARIKRYSPRQKLDRLHIESISQASANQRQGRCGRIASGICYRLYSEADFQSRAAYTDPEILRASLSGVILRMLSLGLGRLEDFPFIDAPDAKAIADGWQQLTELGAVDKQRLLTDIGRQMANWPIDVKLARMLIAAKQHGCLREVMIIAAYLSIQEPRERPADAREAADRAHAEFVDPQSEFVSILKLWDAYKTAHEDLTQSKLRGWCEKKFLGFLRMREWRELHRQLLLSAEQLGWQQNDVAAEYPLLHRALIAGLPGNIGHKTEKALYDAPRQRKFSLFPGSPISKSPPAWVLAANILDTQKIWGLTLGKIEPEWVIAELNHLLARKHFDPHWSRAQGRVIGYEQISLFGLLLAAKKPVHYGGLYPEEAREIFVRQALLTGEINTRSSIVQKNLNTLAKAIEEEAKLRRAGIVVDEDWQARWYLDRVPAEINSAQGFDAWYHKLAPEKKKTLEWSLSDLLPNGDKETNLFPKYFALGDARLALHYRFEPGSEDDGVTLDVPLHLLMALDNARLGWLVPGLIEEKATALIRGLPKNLRRNYVPAPDFAHAFAQAYPAPTADAIAGELARFLTRTTGAPVQALDFDGAGIDKHLQMNLRLADRKTGAAQIILAQSRDLAELKKRFGPKAEKAFAEHAGERLLQEGLKTFPDSTIPLQVPGAAGVLAYPALVDDGESVALRVFADKEQAQSEHERGVRRCAEFALVDKIKQARKQLPVSPKLGLLYAAIENSERLREDIVTAALKALLQNDLAQIRDKAQFEARMQILGRDLFPEAVKNLNLAETILASYAQIKPKLESNLMGWARANLDDLQMHLRSLVHPGFLRETAAIGLREFPRYMKAIALRAERALADPVKDQARMLELKSFTDALNRAQEKGQIKDLAWQQFRWDCEELRVQVFAQELGTQRSVSAKRLAKQLELLN
ncbi:MAG: ATP-dependent RNA helicase HrpA [Arenimonas sp.]